jgi:hypothetical protein
VLSFSKGPGDTPTVFVGRTDVSPPPRPPLRIQRRLCQVCFHARILRVYCCHVQGIIVAPLFPPSAAAAAGPSPLSFGWDPIFQPNGYNKTYVVHAQGLGSGDLFTMSDALSTWGPLRWCPRAKLGRGRYAELDEDVKLAISDR